jgi:hypothetical protein
LTELHPLPPILFDSFWVDFCDKETSDSRMEPPCIAKPICDILRKWDSEEQSIDEVLSEVSEELNQGKNEPGNL